MKPSTNTRQQKKIFTRMLINNWGGIGHKVMEFHEYVNLFSGKSGSGKSTVMDAIQVVLYGSVSANFLNKAADDAKNRRSVLSYLRGAQKDGSFNRDGIDFCSQIVLEIKDTRTNLYTCAGVAFEVGKHDMDLKKYNFFSHSGKLPENEYLTEEGVSYSIAQIRKLIDARGVSMENRGRGDVNRIYPSKEAYLNTLYDVIFGYIEPGRLITMEKSAIALRMTNGTGQFIKDYMFPKSKENTVATISEQLAAYREIKERVEDLEKRMKMLDEIQKYNQALIGARADKMRVEMILRYIEIESSQTKLVSKKQELQTLLEVMEQMEKTQETLKQNREKKNVELIEVEAALKSSDYGQKEKEYRDLLRTIEILAGNSKQWRQLQQRMRRWEEDEVISDYISNRTLQMLEDFQKGSITKELCDDLKQNLDSLLEDIQEELQVINQDIQQITKELNEKKEIVLDLQNDRKPYRKELKEARRALQSELSAIYGRTIPVEIFADLFDVTDDKWKNAVEGRMGRIKHSLITAPQFALDAAKIFRKMKKFEEIDLINSDAIVKSKPVEQEGSLYETVQAEEKYVNECLKHYLGRIQKCETVEELSAVREGVTPDCYAYGNYIFRHLREKDYTIYACIGTKVSKAKLKELQEEVYELQKEQISLMQTRDSFNQVQKFERLSQEGEQLVQLAQSAGQLEKYLQKQDKLEQELKELKEGTLTAELNQKKQALTMELRKIEKEQENIQRELVSKAISKGNSMSEIDSIETQLESLKSNLTEDGSLHAEVLQEIEKQSEAVYRREINKMLQTLLKDESDYAEERAKARNQFNRVYPSYGFSGLEHDNTVYDEILEKCKKDFEPEFKEEFQKQYKMVYHTLRENVIATIHSEMKAAFRHKREINQMLAKIKFSDSIYQIDILPAENENGQFYDMLMAEELDSKVIDDLGFDGQMSLGEDLFYQKYEQKIMQLTEKFMPTRESDNVNMAAHNQEMEKFADYRNYLTFSMYEKVEDESGNIKKNAVDEMAGRDSGGEGQNPKYVALLAGFAMLYMQQSSRDSKIRLVLLDEAFSKMDKERSEVCLRYARELDLQLIVCVPDERLQSLIRNVDSVYGFRRHQNQVSMMHIDKGDYLKLIEGRID